jgi:hypothetical protein
MAMTPHRTSPTFEVETIVRGVLPPGVRAEAVRMVRALAGYAHEPVLHAKVRLTRTGDPARLRRVVVELTLDVSGRLVIAQAVGNTTQDALRLVRDRMRQRLDRTARHWEARRGRLPAAPARQPRPTPEPVGPTGSDRG